MAPYEWEYGNEPGSVNSATAVTKPVDWFGLSPLAWRGSPKRSFSMALWRIDQPEEVGFRTDPIGDAHMICVHLAGRMEWGAKLDDRVYRLPCLPNTFCIARAGETADIEHSNAHASFVHLYLPVRWLEEQASDGNSDGRRRAIELIDPMNARSFGVGMLAARAAVALRRGGVSARLDVEAAGLSLVAMLIRDHSSHSSENACRGGLSPAQTGRAIEALAASLATGIGLAELAATAGLSAPHFCRAFRQSTGLPPHRYQIALRIERAQEMLGRGDSIATVAAAVGYDDPAYFSRLFHRQIGTTPTAYRRDRLS